MKDINLLKWELDNFSIINKIVVGMCLDDASFEYMEGVVVMGYTLPTASECEELFENYKKRFIEQVAKSATIHSVNHNMVVKNQDNVNIEFVLPPARMSKLLYLMDCI